LIIPAHIAGIPVEEMFESYGAPVAIGIGALVFSRHWMGQVRARLARLKRRRR
jgi:hypothetical protein